MSELGIISINLGLGTANFKKGINNANQQLRTFEKTATNSFNNVNKSLNTLRLATITGALVLVTRQALNSARSISRLADGYTELNNKMKLVYSTESSGTRALNSVFEIAQKTAQSVDSVAQVYQRFAQNAQTLGLAQAEVAGLTETVAKAIAISGASSASAEASLMQFGQALASGVLRGEELNSVMEQTPALSQAIAEGLGVGIGQLRDLGKAGKLTAQEVVRALTNISSEVNDKFSTKKFTIGESFVNLENNAIKVVGEFDKLYNVSGTVAGVINTISQNLDSIAKVGVIIGAGFGLNKIASFVTSTRKLRLEQQQADRDNTEAQARQSQLLFDKIRKEERVLALKREQVRTSLSETQAKISTATPNSSEHLKLLADEQRLKNTLSRTNDRYATTISKLKNAHLENRVAQLNYNTMIRTTATSTTLLGRVSLVTTGAINSLKVAFMSNPFGFVIGALTTAISLLTIFSSTTEKAKDKTDELAQQIGQSFEHLDKLGKNQKKLLLDQTEDLKAALKEQLKEQERIITESQEKLNKAQRKKDVVSKFDDSNYSKQGLLHLANKSIAESTREITKARAEQERITKELNKATEKTAILTNDTLASNNKVNQNAIDFNKSLEEQRQLLTLTGDALLDYKAKMLVARAGIEENSTEYSGLLKAQKEILQLQESKKDKKDKPQKVRVDESYNAFKNKLADLKGELSTAQRELDSLSKHGVVGVASASEQLIYELESGGHGLNKLTASNINHLKALADSIDEVKRKTAQANAQQELKLYKDDNTHELATYGLSAKDKAIADFNREQDLKLPELKISLGVDEALAHIQQLKDEYVKAMQQMEERRFNPQIADVIAGLKNGMLEWGNSVMSVAQNVGSIVKQTMDNMAGAISEMVLTGKADFKGLAVSILSDISKMIVKMLIFKAIQSSVSGTSYGAALGFAGGGYTGHGGKHQPAGIVHKGEYVITKEATARLGIGYLNSLNYGKQKGYANGGVVGLSTFNPDTPHNSTPNVNVTVINSIGTGEAKVKTSQGENGDLNVTVELIRKIAKETAKGEIVNNLRAGGLLANAR